MKMVVHMHVVVCVYGCEFQNEIILRGEECKTRVKSNSQMTRVRLMKPSCPGEIRQNPKRRIFFRFSRQRGLGDTWHDDTCHVAHSMVTLHIMRAKCHG